jgi:6-pyruvoyltetrahydropterin/6-carboxytetrahydropterin synthase
MFATLSKRFTFDAAHCLPKLGPDHKCHRLHGHTYEVEIVCRGKVDERGFVIDYDDLAKAWSQIHGLLDHRYLNEIDGLETPSTENLVAWMFKFAHNMNQFVAEHGYGLWDRVWPVLERIRIQESSTTWCEMSKVEWLAYCGPSS